MKRKKKDFLFYLNTFLIGTFYVLAAAVLFFGKYETFEMNTTIVACILMIVARVISIDYKLGDRE